MHSMMQSKLESQLSLDRPSKSVNTLSSKSDEVKEISVIAQKWHQHCGSATSINVGTV